jgi:F0F1-type ATP synthase membrane subunit c/vacuolar-type H+-ATPase subunit K
MALSMGVVLFGIVSQFALRSTPLVFEITDSIDYIPMVFVSGALIGQWKLRENMLQNIDRNLSLQEKLAKHQITSIITWALLEGAALFALVISFINSSGICLIFGVLALMGLISLFPTRQKISNDLKLSNEEISKI